MDGREYKSCAEFAADVRMIFTNCYKYNPPDHDVVQMARKLQDVFEMRFAKIPDDPPDRRHGGEGSDSGDTDGESGHSSDDSEEEREKKLMELQQQVGFPLFSPFFCVFELDPNAFCIISSWQKCKNKCAC